MSGMIRGAVAVVAALALAGSCAAQEKREGLEEAASALAESIKAAATADGQKAVQVALFAPAVPGGPNHGPGISAALTQALGTFAAKESPYQVNGEFAFVPDDKDVTLTYVRITATMTHVVNGRILKRFNSIDSPLIKRISAIASLGTQTGTIPEKGRADGANRALHQIRVNPTGAKDGDSIVKPSAKSPFGVEVLVKANGHGPALPKAASVDGGNPFVPLGVKDVYEVKVYNFGPDEAAFTLSLDGLDQFLFTKDRNPDGSAQYGHVVLPAAKDGKPGVATVFGWHDRFDAKAKKHHYFEFLVAENGKGEFSKFPTVGRGSVGVINVQFCRAFSPSTPDEIAKVRGETAKGQAGATTGDVVMKVVAPAHEFVSIRYNRPEK